MSTETDIRDALDGILTGGGHNQVNVNVNQTLPYGVFYEITGTIYPDIHGSIQAEARLYQVDIFAATQEQAKGLALGSVKTAILALGGDIVTTGFNGDYDPVSRSYCYITEYRFWIT